MRRRFFTLNSAKIKALVLTLIAITAVGILPTRVWGQLATLSASSIADPTLTPGSVFTTYINITDVANLFGMEFKLSFDPNVLLGLSITAGSFWTTGVAEWVNMIDPSGFVWYSVTRPLGETQGLTGSGTLATIDFLVLGLGISPLVIYDDLMGDPFANPIDHDLVHGQFANAPVASFTYSPLEPLVNEVITFNASGSKSMEVSGNITQYEWNFGDGNVTTVSGSVTNLPSPIVTHDYDQASEPYYLVNLTVTDNQGVKDSDVKLLRVENPGIYVYPTFGPVGTKVLVRGFGFQPGQGGALFYDDMNMNYELFTDPAGRFNSTFNVPLSSPGEHTVKAMFYYLGVFNTTTFLVIDTTPLEVNVDVGAIHFRGEIAQFHIQTVFKGTPVDVTERTATLYKPDKTKVTLSTSRIATGLYNASYTIPVNDPVGSYALVANVRYQADVIDSNGTSMKSFLLPTTTLNGWNAWLIETVGNIATIKTDIGTIKVNMSNINAELVDVEGNIGTIESDIGTIKTILEEWTGTVSSITTPTGTTYRILVLTTSEFSGEVGKSDYALEIPVTGPTGSSGTLQILVPKQLLPDIASSIDKIEITIDGSKVEFTTEEQVKVYSLRVSYTHSAHTIMVYLTGAPPIFPWTLVVGLIAAIAAIVVLGMLLLRRRRAKAEATQIKEGTVTTLTKP